MQKIQQYLFEDVSNQLNQSHRIKSENLMIFRIFSALFMTSALIQESLITKTFSQNFLYLTLWGAYTTYFYFTLASCENVSYYITKKQYFGETLWKTCTLLFILGFCLEIPIMLIYWGYIFPQENLQGVQSWVLNINVHCITGVLMIIEIFLNDIVFKLRQSIILLLTALIYLIVNMSFVLISSKVIYPGINWKNWISYVISIITLLIVFGVFALGLIFYRKVKLPKMKQQLLQQ